MLLDWSVVCQDLVMVVLSPFCLFKCLEGTCGVLACVIMGALGC